MTSDTVELFSIQGGCIDLAGGCQEALRLVAPAGAGPGEPAPDRRRRAGAVRRQGVRPHDDRGHRRGGGGRHRDGVRGVPEQAHAPASGVGRRGRRRRAGRPSPRPGRDARGPRRARPRLPADPVRPRQYRDHATYGAAAACAAGRRGERAGRGRTGGEGRRRPPGGDGGPCGGRRRHRAARGPRRGVPRRAVVHDGRDALAPPGRRARLDRRPLRHLARSDVGVDAGRGRRGPRGLRRSAG